MKKILNFLIICILTINLTGCNFAFVDSDSETAKKHIEQFLNYLQDTNADNVKSLFAINAIKNIENFDEDITKLFEYYDGEYKSFTNDGLGTFGSVDYGKKNKYYIISSDVETSTNKYRIALKWYVEDDYDSKNIGIHSLYIIKFDDDPNPEYSYGGDGLWTNGINIGKVWIEREETE